MVTSAAAKPIVLLGETGTGKTHLATGLAVAACRQRKRVRVTTAAQLVNELVEAKNQSEINRVTNRRTRYELIVIDEMAYVAMPESAAELLFQVIAGWAERAAGDHYDQSTVLGMDHHVSQCAVVQGNVGPIDRRGAHHRNRVGIVSVPPNVGEEREQDLTGWRSECGTGTGHRGDTFTLSHRKQSRVARTAPQ